MTPQTEFLELLVKTAEEKCVLDSSISLEELPAEGGLYAELGEGFTDTGYFDKTEVKVLPVLILCRDADQMRGLEQLNMICNYFQRLKEYPQGSSFAWLNTEIAKGPARIGRDEDGVYHFSCILNNKIYF